MAGSNVDIKTLFNKLGHKLEEIRVRALKSLVSKLEHGVLSEVDLVQERHLLIRLLEWFNFPSCPQQQQVLQLLHTLTKHESAAALVIEVGGVEFLSQLRLNIEPSLQSLVDACLDQLFHLPSGPPVPQQTAECIYKSATPYSQTGHTEYSTNQDNTSVWSAHTTHTGTMATQPLPAMPQRDPVITPRSTHRDAPSYSTPDSQAGYFGHASAADLKPQPQESRQLPGAAAACFKFSTFPWVALTPTDRHVLSSTDTSLRNREVSLVVSACEFLSDVVFQDFPAEVFLQRPSIIKSLLSLVSGDPVDGVVVTTHAMRALRDLAVCLEGRIAFYQDPAMYSPKQDFTSSVVTSFRTSSVSSPSPASSDMRPPVIGKSDMQRPRGDGQDGDRSRHTSVSSSLGVPHLGNHGYPPEELDYEDAMSLQFTQWTLAQFCASLLPAVLPNLTSTSRVTVRSSLELLYHVNCLLGEAISPSALWQDNSAPAMELVEKFHESFELLCHAVHHHHHSRLSAATPEAELSQHRLVFVGVAVFTADLVTLLVPVDKVELALPETTHGMLRLLCHDASLVHSHGEVCATLLPYLRHLDPEAYENHLTGEKIVTSLRATTEFLEQWPEQLSVNIVHLVSLAESSLPALPYHQHLPFIQAAVSLASQVCRKSSPNPLAMQQSRGVLLHLLAHPLEEIRSTAYAGCLQIVMESLGVEHVTEPASTSSQGINFLLHCHVLYEICCFGMSDSLKEVEQAAGQILLHLLQGQLLIPSTRWQQLLDALTPVLPVLQGFATLEKSLGGCVLGLLEAEAHIQTGALPLHERLRGTLRLMYRHESRIRSEALGRLAWFITQEPEGLRKLPQFSDLQVTDLANLFIIDPAVSMVDDDTSRSVFQPDGLEKVHAIFVAEGMENDVRKSAVDQLAIMLQDPALHALFLQLDGHTAVQRHLYEGIRKPSPGKQNPSQTMLPSLLKILRHLVQRNSSLRHQLAQENAIYYTVLRCSLLYMADDEARSEASQLLALLLWDEVASVKPWTVETGGCLSEELTFSLTFSLPEFITNRFRLPFRCPVHHSESPYRVQSPAQPDPLTQRPLGEVLRLSWQAAWHSGVENLAKDCLQPTGAGHDTGYTGPLELTVVDRLIITTSHLQTAIRRCVSGIENATSHSAVTDNVSRLAMYVVCSRMERLAPVLLSVPWKEAVDRFLQVHPSSATDESLLDEVLYLVCLVLKVKGQPDPDLVTWLSGLLHSPQGALLTLLAKPESSNEDLPESALQIRRQLNRQLLRFVYIFVGKIPYSLSGKHREAECVRGPLTRSLLMRLTVGDASHFYNLASLERTLLALMHITARPGWTLGCATMDTATLSTNTLHSLLEVVSAFHFGRGGMSMSYMGRGVTRSATLCLRHLAYEMATQLKRQDWSRSWLFSKQPGSDCVGSSGLEWLTPLWTYRDTEARTAGIGIAVALTSTEAGRITMTTHCQHITGGIWGAAFSILSDQSECSLVRQQAALLLVNLTSQPLGGSSEEAGARYGPVVHDEHSQVSLYGLPALLALLHHSQFYLEIVTMLTTYSPQPAIHPVSVATNGSTTTFSSTQTTLTSTGSGPESPPWSRNPLDDEGWQPVTSTPASDTTPLLRPSVVGQPVGSGQQYTLPVTDHRPASTPVSMSTTTTSRATTPVSSMQPASGTTSGTSEMTIKEYHSITAPGLVAAITRLLGNLIALAPEDTLQNLSQEGVLKMLTSVLDFNLLEAYIGELPHTARRPRYEVAFSDLLQAHIGVLRVLQCGISLDDTIRAQLTQEVPALKHCAQLLAISYQAVPDISALCEQLWEDVLILFRLLIECGGQDVFWALTPILTRHWYTIAARCVNILQTPSYLHSSLWYAVLHFLAVVLSTESSAQTHGESPDGVVSVSYRLDTPSKSGVDTRLFSGPSGSVLCVALIRAYDAVFVQHKDNMLQAKGSVVSALKCLLTVSTSAKGAALEGGLVESLCDHLQRLTLTLSVDALEAPTLSGTSRRKEQNGVVSELVQVLGLLQNLMYNSYDVKVAAYESGTAQCVHRLWAWAQVKPPLLAALLALLTTFTARCPPACRALAFTSAGGERPSGRGQYSPHSLVHCLVKLAQKASSGGSNIAVLRAVFSILATLTLSQECRGILWKSNFIHEFSSVSPKRSKKTKLQRVLEMCWLQLFVNLSFSTEGQSMILKVKEAVCRLVEYASSGSEQHLYLALLTLRNLCFHAANKPKVLADERVCHLLVRSVETGSDKMRSMASSALLALTHNCQKAKGSLKTTSTVRRLQDTYNTLIHLSQKTPDGAQSAINIQDVLTLLRS